MEEAEGRISPPFLLFPPFFFSFCFLFLLHFLVCEMGRGWGSFNFNWTLLWSQMPLPVEYKNKFLLKEQVGFRCLFGLNKPPNLPAGLGTAKVTVTWTPACHNKILPPLRQMRRQMRTAYLQIFLTYTPSCLPYIWCKNWSKTIGHCSTTFPNTTNYEIFLAIQ